MEEPLEIPLGPRLVMVLIGLFFLGMFIGGFYWKTYVFPTLNGPWVVSNPGKYLVMVAFLLFSIIAISVVTPLSRYKTFLTFSTFAGFILFVLGNLVFF